ncbi:serine hydrolase [Bosea sp. 117]|uniref:serine hydrolase n=1 Tax=Bosea sp. 117 TaxID=1125973 RepID=UPI000A9C0CDA|nr:serine hydrolase [Bosea sp. 117]
MMRAGVVLVALAVAGAGVAEAKPKKKRSAARPAATRVVADSGVWKRGYAEIVVDANTGKVLQEVNADALRHPASLTKVMTLYILFEQLETRKLRLDSELTVSAYAASQQPSKLGVKPGSTIRVEDAIKALITRSANDVAVVIAENISGDVASFASLMTRKARALGMSRTTFKNPNGLPNPQQVTTARDFATLGRAIQDRFPRYYPYFATRTFYYRGAAIGNHNRLLGRVEGVDGIKTGYTAASGFNLVTNVRRDGRHLVAVVMGGTSGGSRDARMATLISNTLPRAFAGRQIAAPIAEAPLPADAPEEAAEVAAAPQAAAKPQTIAMVAPAAPAPAPSKPVIAPKPITAAAAMVPPAPMASDDTLTTAAIPVPAPAPTSGRASAVQVATALPPAPGSAAPIVPTPVKTVSVPRPAAPVATIANQPGMLGTLTFSGGSVAQASAAQKPVQVASTGPVQLPRSAAPAVSKTGWAIQIGAFGSEADAQAHIAKAQAKVGALSKADPYTEEAVKGDSRIVRARFAGFNAEAAARNACQALKRNDFPCMVFRN